MRNLLAFLVILGVFGVAGEAAAAHFTASKVSFQDITGEVKIVTTTGEDIELTISQGDVYRSVSAKMEGDTLIVSGEKWRDFSNGDCCDRRIRRTENLARDRAAAPRELYDDEFFSDYPVIEISVPRKDDVSFTDARIKLSMEALDGRLTLDGCYVYGETSTLGQATLDIIAGSRLAIGDVKSMLELDVSGKAAVTSGGAAMADVDIAGPGDVMIGPVDGILDVSIAGSGRVRTGRLDGPLAVRIAGSGAVSVQGGRADKLVATVDGSGGILLEGTAVAPVLRMYGSPVFRFRSVDGRLTRYGHGDVYIDGKLIPEK